MRLAFLVILTIYAQILLCQSVPNGSFEDWHEQDGFLIPQQWNVLDDPVYRTINKVSGIDNGSALQLNVVWDELLKSYVGATLSTEVFFVNSGKCLSGYYKGIGGIKDSLKIEVLVIEDKENHLIGYKNLGGTQNTWKKFQLLLNSDSVKVSDPIKINIELLSGEMNQGVTHFILDEVKITK